VKIEAHEAKAERITRSLAKCTPEDYEAVIEGTMLAGTHWFNVALHRYGVTAADDDVMHAEYLIGAVRLKLSLIAPTLTAALDEIENARPRFVRGDVSGGGEVAIRCLQLLSTLRDFARNATPL
jgi:hypothetical protein